MRHPVDHALAKAAIATKGGDVHTVHTVVTTTTVSIAVNISSAIDIRDPSPLYLCPISLVLYEI